MRKSICLMSILPCMVLVPMQQYSQCYGEDILSAVRSKSLSEIRKLVSRGADIHAKDRYDDSILHKAAWRGDYSIVQYLLTIDGIDVHARSKKGETPLHLAAKRGHKSVVALLLSHGADKKCVDNEGKRPADYIPDINHQDFIECYTLSLANKKNPGSSFSFAVGNKSGSQQKDLSKVDDAFLEAAKKGNVDDLSMFLELGANINACDKYGDTALHKVAWSFRTEAASFLCQKGADKNCLNRNGLTPFQVLITAVVQRIEIDSEERCRSSLSKAEELLYLGEEENLNRQDKDGNTVFHRLLSCQNCWCAKNILLALFENGGALGRPKESWPVDDESLTDHYRGIMRYGAAANLPNNRGETPLSLALKHNAYVSDETGYNGYKEYGPMILYIIKNPTCIQQSAEIALALVLSNSSLCEAGPPHLKLAASIISNIPSCQPAIRRNRLILIL